MTNPTAYFQLLAKEINDTPSSWSFSISFMTTKLFENEISEFNEKGLHTFKKYVAAFSIVPASFQDLRILFLFRRISPFVPFQTGDATVIFGRVKIEFAETRTLCLPMK